MRGWLLGFLLLIGFGAHAADYAREKRWADEITPSILVGEPVELTAGNRKFLAILTPAEKTRAGVIVIHGLGVHPDWNLIGVLRTGLPQAGYTTLSLQMPVLAATAQAEAYKPTYAEAAKRIQAGVDYLKQRGVERIAIVSHSLGAAMTQNYLTKNPTAPIQAWVSIGISQPTPYGKLKLPILDLYGADDLPAVLKNAPARGDELKTNPASKQIVAPSTDHFFNNRDAELVKYVKDYLDSVFPAS